MLIYQPVLLRTVADLSLEDLYGICADDPINLDSSEISDALDEDLAGAFD